MILLGTPPAQVHPAVSSEETGCHAHRWPGSFTPTHVTVTSQSTSHPPFHLFLTNPGGRLRMPSKLDRVEGRQLPPPKPPVTYRSQDWCLSVSLWRPSSKQENAFSLVLHTFTQNHCSYLAPIGATYPPAKPLFRIVSPSKPHHSTSKCSEQNRWEHWPFTSLPGAQ